MSPVRAGDEPRDVLAALMAGGSSSFTELVARVDPAQLPRPAEHAASAGGLAAEATTIVAASCADGVLMAGDRRATMGTVIAQRDIEKVHAADDWSVVGIAGSAGLALDLVRLFQTELEHYEKLEGTSLSLDGKANRLASMIRGNLGLALQGFVVVPLFAGWDPVRGAGRIFSYDATGGRYEETAFHAVGSGSAWARGSLKKLHRPGATRAEGVRALLQALYDAADDDAATGGPDLMRRIFPVVWHAGPDGVRRFTDAEVTPWVEEVVAQRAEHPDGPPAGEASGREERA